MRYKLLFTIIASVAYSAAAVAQNTEGYGPFNLDGGKIACNSDKGPEIKKYQNYKATSDRFFVEDTLSVMKVSGWGKGNSCAISDIQRKKIKVTTDYGDVEVSVIDNFTVYAWADCGSGWANNSGGKTASIECSVAAKTQKYTNK